MTELRLIHSRAHQELGDESPAVEKGRWRVYERQIDTKKQYFVAMVEAGVGEDAKEVGAFQSENEALALVVELSGWNQPAR